MKKIVKLTALFLTLAVTVAALGGCIIKHDTTGSGKVIETELHLAVPFDSESPLWANFETMLKDYMEYYKSDSNTLKFRISRVPEPGTDDYKAFVKNVAAGKVDLFVSPACEEIDQLIEDKKIASLKIMTAKDSAITSSLIPTYKRLTRAYDGASYMVPVLGTFQGLFYNKDVFETAQVPVPTDWASLQAAIPALKEKGVTPFAAGFADGAGYWLDEMILAEGGRAEHAALPAKGVINSWKRAVTDIKNFYNAGAFGANALNATQADAVAQFKSKSAAMILASTKDLGDVTDSNVVFMSFPSSSTGVKRAGDLIGSASYGIYINAKSLNENVDDATSLSGVMYEFINDYYTGSDYYADFLSEDGKLPFNTGLAGDIENPLMKQCFTVVKSAQGADTPLAGKMLCYDRMETGLADVLTGAKSVNDYLSEVSEAEIEAQNAVKEQEKKSDKKDDDKKDK